MIAMRWRWRLAAHLKGKFGWKSVYAWNDETFGPTGTLGRKDTTEAVLIHDLRAALQRLNPELPPSAGDSARYGSITSEWDPIGIVGIHLKTRNSRFACALDILIENYEGRFRASSFKLRDRRSRESRAASSSKRLKQNECQAGAPERWAKNSHY